MRGIVSLIKRISRIVTFIIARTPEIEENLQKLKSGCSPDRLIAVSLLELKAIWLEIATLRS